MRSSVDIGVIGDFNPESSSHTATNSALQHAAAPLHLAVSVSWVPTPELDHGLAPERLSPFHGILCSPGSPYRSMSGALAGITFARERGWPFFGT
ncbi:MAG TPA: hypothetical protein VLT62_07245 [Candidatus Methylomirabilis sp.]|nr:hypothetical protein [Candidatus Methylomirabilis sp.]